MAGQFDNWKKILSTSSSRPDVYMRDPEKDEAGNVTQVFPKIVAPAPTIKKSDVDLNGKGKDTNITKATVNVAKGRIEDTNIRNLERNQKYYFKGTAKSQREGLATTTMRLNEDTGEVYDTEDNRPAPSGRVMPKRKANPKYLAADVQRQNEDLKKFTEEDTNRNLGGGDTTGEGVFNAGEKAKGSTLRSVNGVTFDTKDYDDYLNTIAANNISKAPQPYDISEFESKKTTSSGAASTPKVTVKEGPNKSEDPSDYEQDPTFTRVKKVKARKGGTLHGVKEVRDFETEHPDSDQSSAATGKTTAAANKNSSFTEPLAKPTKRTIVTEPARAVVEESISDSAHDLRASMSEGQDPDITSTTMREVPAEGPAAPVRIKDLPGKPIAAVPTRTSRNTAPYAKPTVNKPGYVIPPIAMDTFGAQEVDREQAEKERRIHVKNKIESTKTTVLDPNERPAKAVAGQTPEAALIAASRREVYAGELAKEGKTLTTVHPAVLDTAKRLGLTDMYNLDKDYVNSTAFLAHPAIRKATVAHEYGVHHLLGTENDLLHQYLGEKPIKAEELLSRAYKIVDRKRRGNPESEPGEYEGLGAMIRAGSSPQQTLRAIRSGKKTDVTINGVTPTLAPGSSYNRSVTHDNASKITDQVETAPKVAQGVVASKPYAPKPTDPKGVAVRRIGQPLEEAEPREFSPRELRNKKKYVPTSDDSKRKAGAGPVEETVNEESDIIDRLKKGPKYAEPFEF